MIIDDIKSIILEGNESIASIRVFDNVLTLGVSTYSDSNGIKSMQYIPFSCDCYIEIN